MSIEPPVPQNSLTGSKSRTTAPPRRSDPDPDPTNVAGLAYRIFSRWRIMLGALVAVIVIVSAIALAIHLTGPVRIQIGPIGIEPALEPQVTP